MADRPTLQVAIADAYPHVHGGARVQVLALAADLAAAGVPVRLITCGLGSLVDDAAAQSLPTTVVPATGPLARYAGSWGVATAARMPGYWSRARRAMRGVDVAHCNDHRGLLLFGPAARSVGARLLWHVHATAAGALIDQACARLADLVVVPSPALVSRYDRWADVEVVPGLVPHPPHDWAPTSPPRIVAIGRLFPSKGLADLVAAMADVVVARPEVHLDIVGEEDATAPGHAAELRAQVATLGIEQSVTFHGHLDDPWAVGAGAALFVQASRDRETQGLALREAVSLGIPTVATDLAAWADLPADAPRRVPPKAPDALAEAILVGLDTDPPAGPHPSGPDPVSLADRFVPLYERLRR